MQNTADLWEVLCRDFQKDRSRLSQAQHLDAAEQFLESARQVLRPDSNRLSDAYEIAADLCRAAGGEQTAIRYYQEAFRLSAPDVAPEAAARLAGKLAILHEEAGGIPQALALFEQAINYFEQAGDHRQQPALLSHCAALERSLGDRGKARQHYEEAIRIATQLHGEANAEVAGLLSNFGVALCEWKDFAEAEICHLRALQIYESAYGSTHPDVGQSMGNLAVLYHVKKDHARAIRFYRAAVEILSRTREPNDPDLQTLRVNLEAIQKATHRVR